MLFVNPVVSHTRITHLRAIRRPHGLLISREVSGNLHNTVFTLLVVGCGLRVGRIRPSLRSPRATCHRQLEQTVTPDVMSRVADPEPLRITIIRRLTPAPRRETPRRTRVFESPSLVRLLSRGFAGLPARARARRPDRRGQVPKGAGGMPRRHQHSGVEGCDKSGGAAQRASIPECPRNPGN